MPLWKEGEIAKDMGILLWYASYILLLGKLQIVGGDTYVLDYIS